MGRQRQHTEAPQHSHLKRGQPPTLAHLILVVLLLLSNGCPGSAQLEELREETATAFCAAMGGVSGCARCVSQAFHPCRTAWVWLLPVSSSKCLPGRLAIGHLCEH